MKTLLILFLASYSLKSATVSGNISEESSSEVVIGAAVAIYELASPNDTLSFLIDSLKLKSKPIRGAYCTCSC